VFKKLLTAAWLVLVFACCQFAAAATTVTVSATPSNPTAPANVTLAVTATSDTGPVMATQVEYFNGATSLGIALQAPFTLNVNELAAGTYQITAKVTTTDPDNPVVQSQALALTVGAAPGAATAYFIHTDQLDTPRVITNGNGAPVWHWDSDPFGKDTANEQPSGQPAFTFNLRYPGQQFDRESNLHYNYHRDYDSQIGRYLQSDPVGLRAGVNTYGYVGGNPLSLIDPFGLEAATIQCDGNGNYEVVNTNTGPSRPCTEIHENQHIKDYIGQYGKNSCVGLPKGSLPHGAANGLSEAEFHRQSECREYTAAMSCVKKCDDGGAAKRKYDWMMKENFCGDEWSDEWKNPKWLKKK